MSRRWTAIVVTYVAALAVWAASAPNGDPLPPCSPYASTFPCVIYMAD